MFIPTPSRLFLWLATACLGLAVPSLIMGEAPEVLDDFDILLVHRRPNPAIPKINGLELGLPSNHECNSSLPRTGYDNEIARLASGPEGPRLHTVFRPEDGGYVGEIDIHWEGDRFLFTRSTSSGWSIWEMRLDGSPPRPVSHLPDGVDAFDACYLPDGRIVFGSTASCQSVPCWHGQRRVSNLYLMHADGTGVRQLCFDQDHDFHPVVLPNGQVLYHRWDYTGINHIFMRQLMVMNPDGTGQRAVYGSNTWFPNALYFPRPLPGRNTELVSILSGYHGVHRMGRLVLLDTARGWQGTDGIVRRISGRGDGLRPEIKDNLVSKDWPKFLHPFPVDADRFLVSSKPNAKTPWGLYLAGRDDQLTRLYTRPDAALLEPVAVRRTPRPPVIPDRVDLTRQDAVVMLQDVYAGPGLRGVPRGTARQLRVLAYHFGYPGLAGPDKVGYGGPWEVMRILGTVPLAEDGSAHFRVPANTPLALQPLDAEGKALQLMRSWFTAMPGEHVSCVGCHESPAESGPPRVAEAALRQPSEIQPWYGPARGFSFDREVQPVLDRRCAGCHDGTGDPRPDLRAAGQVPDYPGRPISELGQSRLHPAMQKATGGTLRYSPAYDALLDYVRRVGIEDDVSLLTPAEYHADTSPLIQLLQQGHQGVQLSAEDWDRLVTWIDLNAPYYGTWGELYPVPDGMHERRMDLCRRFGGPATDPEHIPDLPPPDRIYQAPPSRPRPEVPTLTNWPFSAEEARRRQSEVVPRSRRIDLGGGVTLELVGLPAGSLVMGDPDNETGAPAPVRAAVKHPFWIGAYEITNEQFRRFDTRHHPRYYAKRHARTDDRGLTLADPTQPAVRVSWEQARAFCRWLSERSGRTFDLPTEQEWEYACRAGSDQPLFFGGLDTDFSPWANMADRRFSRGYGPDGRQTTGGVDHLLMEGAALSDTRFDDQAVVTVPAGRYRPNAWGLFDMHGNAAEWTRSPYTPGASPPGVPPPRQVVRGGSFLDPPARCRSGYRIGYPAWQQLATVGFRVVCRDLP